MQIIGLSAEEQTEIFRMLAAILWLGNVPFEEMDDGNARVRMPNGYVHFVFPWLIRRK